VPKVTYARNTTLKEDVKEIIDSLVKSSTAPVIKGKVRDQALDRSVAEMSAGGDYETSTKKRDNEVR